MSPSHSNTKAQHFVGLARIDIDELDFSFALQKNHREQSEKAKLRLLSVFKLEGCRRFEEENFIDATIDTENLDLSLRQAQVLPSDFKTASLSALLEPFKIPRLKVHRPVACYNGLHRVLAAKEFLDRNDRWWVIRLHSSEGLTSRSSSRIIEGFAHEQVYTDGTIFRNIRQYNRQEDAEDSENRWWARLTETKRKDLRQLLKNKRMTKAFDELLDFPGLWTPIQLGTLHRLHGLRCPEELVNYLSHIKTVWTHIVPDPRLRQYVDTPTVLNLELYAPGLSSHDDSCVTKLMDEMRIFPMLHAHSDRASLLRSLKSITCLIPSIRTFFENQKYLEPCSTILRQLLGDSEKRSLWLGFSANYFEPDQLCIQQNERFSKRLECHTYPKQTLGYLQLWLFCLRNFPEMTNITPKMTSKREKVRREHNPTLWHKLGKLAVDLGFRTDTAVELSRQSPDAEHADQFLRAARPYWNGNREEAVGAVVELLGSMREDGPATNCSGFTTTEILDRELRCGKPKDNDHEIDKHHLFLSLFHKEVDAGECLTSLYVKRDLIEAFFNPYLLQASSYFDSTAMSVDELSFSLNEDPRSFEVPESAHTSFVRLREENHYLRSENEDLKSRIGQLDADSRKFHEKWNDERSRLRLALQSQQEQSNHHASDHQLQRTELASRLERSEAAQTNAVILAEQNQQKIDILMQELSMARSRWDEERKRQQNSSVAADGANAQLQEKLAAIKKKLLEQVEANRRLEAASQGKQQFQRLLDIAQNKQALCDKELSDRNSENLRLEQQLKELKKAQEGLLAQLHKTENGTAHLENQLRETQGSLESERALRIDIEMKLQSHIQEQDNVQHELMALDETHEENNDSTRALQAVIGKDGISTLPRHLSTKMQLGFDSVLSGFETMVNGERLQQQVDIQFIIDPVMALKDEITIYLVDFLDGFRSVRYGIHVGEEKDQQTHYVNHFLQLRNRHSLVGYVLHRISGQQRGGCWRIIKDYDSPEIFIQTCRASDGCFFGTEEVMSAFTKEALGKERKRISNVIPNSKDSIDRRKLRLYGNRKLQPPRSQTSAESNLGGVAEEELAVTLRRVFDRTNEADEVH